MLCLQILILKCLLKSDKTHCVSFTNVKKVYYLSSVKNKRKKIIRVKQFILFTFKQAYEKTLSTYIKIHEHTGLDSLSMKPVFEKLTPLKSF